MQLNWGQGRLEFTPGQPVAGRQAGGGCLRTPAPRSTTLLRVMEMSFFSTYVPAGTSTATPPLAACEEEEAASIAFWKARLQSAIRQAGRQAGRGAYGQFAPSMAAMQEAMAAVCVWTGCKAPQLRPQLQQRTRLAVAHSPKVLHIVIGWIAGDGVVIACNAAGSQAARL